jgi:hypothetical protein
MQNLILSKNPMQSVNVKHTFETRGFALTNLTISNLKKEVYGIGSTAECSTLGHSGVDPEGLGALTHQILT